MAIFKRKNRSGTISWFIDYYDNSGKRIRKSFPIKSQAEDALAHFKQMRYEENVMGIKRKPKYYFEELAEEYLKYSKTRFGKASHQTNEAAVKSFLPFFSSKYLDEINLKDIESYKTFRLQVVKPATLNRNINTLKRMFNLAEEWGFIGESLSSKIKKVRENANRIRYLSWKEIEKLLKECKLPYLKLIVLIALNTGMRRGEILSLTWEQIDLENDFIHLEMTKNGRRRDIPINPLLHKEIKKWLDITPNKTGFLFEVKDIKKSFGSMLKRAGIKNFRFHDLRHTFASHLVMQGVDLATVSRLLGHSTIDMTMRYSHLSPDHTKRAVDKMGSLIKDK